MMTMTMMTKLKMLLVLQFDNSVYYLHYYVCTVCIYYFFDYILLLIIRYYSFFDLFLVNSMVKYIYLKVATTKCKA